jgi:hypothetical protein
MWMMIPTLVAEADEYEQEKIHYDDNMHGVDVAKAIHMRIVDSYTPFLDFCDVRSESSGVEL